MCESNAYFKKGGNEELVLKEVSVLKPLPDGEVFLENILGEQKTLKARIQEIDFMAHKIILE
jgi:predicted RNA-binding protein